MLFLAIYASSALAETEEAPVEVEAEVACADLRRTVNAGYADRKADTAKAVATYKKLYATALDPLTRFKSHLSPDHLAEIKNALSGQRPVDARFSAIEAVVSKSFNDVGPCKKGYFSRLGDERDFRVLNIQTFCVNKENEFQNYLPAQTKVYFAQGRIAFDTHSVLGKDQLVQDGCPGRPDCFLKVESTVIGKESENTLRNLELVLDLTSPELSVRPALETGLRNLDPEGILASSRETYVDTMLRDTLGRPDCAAPLPAPTPSQFPAVETE